MVPSEQDMTVLISRPRFILARASMPVFSVLFAVPHGPHSADSTDGEGLFWKEVVCDMCRLAYDGERIIMMTDANAHVHAEDGKDHARVALFIAAMRDLGLCGNTAELPIASYWSDATHSVQDDYVPTSAGLTVVANSQ